MSISTRASVHQSKLRSVGSVVFNDESDAFVSIKGTSLSTRPNTTANPTSPALVAGMLDGGLPSNPHNGTDDSSSNQSNDTKRSKSEIQADNEQNHEPNGAENDQPLDFSHSLLGYHMSPSSHNNAVSMSRVSQAVDRWWKNRDSYNDSDDPFAPPIVPRQKDVKIPPSVPTESALQSSAQDDPLKVGSRRQRDIIKALEREQNSDLLEGLRSGRLSFLDVQKLLQDKGFLSTVPREPEKEKAPEPEPEQDPQAGMSKEALSEYAVYESMLTDDDVMHLGKVEPWKEVAHDAFSEFHLSRPAKALIPAAGNTELKGGGSINKDNKLDFRAKRLDSQVSKDRKLLNTSNESSPFHLANMSRRRETDMTQQLPPRPATQGGQVLVNSAQIELSKESKQGPTSNQSPAQTRPIVSSNTDGKLEVVSLECIIKKGQKSNKNSIVYDPEEDLSDEDGRLDTDNEATEKRAKQTQKAEKALRQLEKFAALARPKVEKQKTPSTGLYESYQLRKSATTSTTGGLDADQMYVDEWRQQRLVATMTMKELKKIFPPLVHTYRRNKDPRRRDKVDNSEGDIEAAHLARLQQSDSMLSINAENHYKVSHFMPNLAQKAVLFPFVMVLIVICFNIRSIEHRQGYLIFHEQKPSTHVDIHMYPDPGAVFNFQTYHIQKLHIMTTGSHIIGQSHEAIWQKH
jgi:hypothetical protein